MPQKMRRNATRNISAPTGKTAAMKIPSPSASAQTPTQRHGPNSGGPGGRGGGFEYMLFPSSPGRSPAPFYTKAAAAFLLYRDKASNFVMLSFVILDILSSLCNIKNNFT